MTIVASASPPSAPHSDHIKVDCQTKVIDSNSPRSVDSIDQPPVISLAQSDEDLAVAVSAACERWGFFQVVDHGVNERIREMFDKASRNFFALDNQEKLKCERSADNARGFVAREQTKQKWDHKECFDVGNKVDWNAADDAAVNRGMNGVNRFPEEQALPGFRGTFTDYFHEMEALAERVGGLMALGMGVEKDYFKKVMTSQHTSHLRLNWYPEAEKQIEGIKGKETPFGVGAHTDSGFLTVLAQDDRVHTLQCQDRLTGKWITITPVPGAFTINTGDLSVVFSNGRYHAPLHRVLTSSIERYSAPYFYNPSYSTEIKPIPSIVNENSPAQFHPLQWGYFRAMRVMGNFGDFGGYVKIQNWAVRKDGKKPVHVERQEQFTSSINYAEPFDINVYQKKLEQMNIAAALAGDAD